MPPFGLGFGLPLFPGAQAGGGGGGDSGLISDYAPLFYTSVDGTSAVANEGSAVCSWASTGGETSWATIAPIAQGVSATKFQKNESAFIQATLVAAQAAVVNTARAGMYGGWFTFSNSAGVNTKMFDLKYDTTAGLQLTYLPGTNELQINCNFGTVLGFNAGRVIIPYTAGTAIHVIGGLNGEDSVTAPGWLLINGVDTAIPAVNPSTLTGTDGFTASLSFSPGQITYQDAFISHPGTGAFTPEQGLAIYTASTL